MSFLTKPSLLVASLTIAFASAFSTSDAAAQGYGCGNAGFLPFGFYQPYGARYSSSIRTPPYFATNPPVYYGARHARPYGLSPFASPPMVSAGSNYNSRLRSNFLEPRVPTPSPILSNPCIHTRAERPTDRNAAGKIAGEVKLNPFFETLAADDFAIDAIQRVAKK